MQFYYFIEYCKSITRHHVSNLFVEIVVVFQVKTIATSIHEKVKRNILDYKRIQANYLPKEVFFRTFTPNYSWKKLRVHKKSHYNYFHQKATALKSFLYSFFDSIKSKAETASSEISFTFSSSLSKKKKKVSMNERLGKEG